MPDHKSCLNFLYDASSPKEDRNLFCVRDGRVLECHRGLPDEVNNELLTNYALHAQSHPLPISGKVQRCIVLRAVVALRSVLIRIRRIESVRPVVVKSLNSMDVSQRVAALKGIDLEALRGQLDTEDVKYLAFHIGQTLALISGVELFTKKSLCEFYPDLQCYIYRENGCPLANLQRLKNELLASFNQLKIQKKGDLALFHVDSQNVSNLLHYQCRGLVLNIAKERIAHWGRNHDNCSFIQSLARIDFPLDAEFKSQSPDGLSFGCFCNEGKLYFTTNTAFDTPETKQLNKLYPSPSLPFSSETFRIMENYLIVSGKKDLVTIARRDKVTLELRY